LSRKGNFKDLFLLSFMFNTPTTLPDFEMISICIVLVWPVFKLPAIRCLIRTVSLLHCTKWRAPTEAHNTHASL